MRLFRDKSEFNEIIIADTKTWGKALILDGELQSTEGDQHIYHEALCSLTNQSGAKNILVLGGGEGATADRILKYGADKQVIMVEIDQKVVDLCKEHMPSLGNKVWEDPRLHLVIGDAFKFVEETTEIYDAVISDLSSPVVDGSSELLFSADFYEKVKKILRPRGLFVMQATGRPELYWSDFKRSFDKAVVWSEWVPSFQIPWYFFGGLK